MKITIHETNRGKVPSVYVGKTFEVRQTKAVGDLCPTLRKNKDGTDAVSTWDAYEGKTKSGVAIRITKFANHPGRIFICREGYARGTWVCDFSIEM